MENIIYNKPNTVTQNLSSTSIIPPIKISSTIHKFIGRYGVCYMPHYSTLYPIALAPYGPYIEKLLKLNNDEELDHILNSKDDKLLSSNILVKSYCKQGKISENDTKMNVRKSTSEIRGPLFYTFNPLMISLQMLDFVVDITKPKTNYTTVIISIPTTVSKAIMDYLYLLTHMFNDVKLVKDANSFWFKDSFYVILTKPYISRIMTIRNLLGQQLRPDKGNKAQFTLKYETFTTGKFTSLFDVDIFDTTFYTEWNKFRTEVQLNVNLFHIIFAKSVRESNIENRFQIILEESMKANSNIVEKVDIVGGGNNNNEVITFEVFLSNNHVRDKELLPIFETFNDLVKSKDYNKNDEDNVLKNQLSFELRGQIKLMLIEIKYLVRIAPYLAEGKHLIIYIGAAPGVHIPNLVKLFNKYDIMWELYDPRPFIPSLSTKNEDGSSVEFPNVTIYLEYFTEQTAKRYSNDNDSNTKFRDYTIHFISDIRSDNGNNTEPTTENLLVDYTIENETVMFLKPKTCLLKWRYPFVDKNTKLEFNRITTTVSEEWLQIFSKPSSSEMRLYLESKDGEYNFRSINDEQCRKVDKMMHHYKVISRYSNHSHLNDNKYNISLCKCNDCSLLNKLSYDYYQVINIGNTKHDTDKYLTLSDIYNFNTYLDI